MKLVLYYVVMFGGMISFVSSLYAESVGIKAPVCYAWNSGELYHFGFRDNLETKLPKNPEPLMFSSDISLIGVNKSFSHIGNKKHLFTVIDRNICGESSAVK